MSELPEHRLKRLKIRSWRRGIKEMDLILGGWSDQNLSRLSPAELDKYETLLDESDHDLYQWVSGQAAPPEALAELIAELARFDVDQTK